jgi:hypothetical protein
MNEVQTVPRMIGYGNAQARSDAKSRVNSPMGFASACRTELNNFVARQRQETLGVR